MTRSVAARRVATPAGLVGPARVGWDADGVIRSIEPVGSSALDVELLAPGFVDLQVNGIDHLDVATADGADWDVLASALASQGTTSWCPTLITAPRESYCGSLDRIAAAMDGQRAGQPCIVGVHLEGPFLGAAPGAHPVRHIAACDVDWLRALPDIVRLVTLAPENPGAPEAITVLTGRGVVVALGHSRPDEDQIERAIAAGATMVTHLFNGMSGVHHREAGLALRTLVDDRLVAGLIADGVHVGDAALRLAVRAKGPNGIALVTDAVAWRTMRPGGARLGWSEGAPRLPDGTLAGSTLTMDGAVRHLVRHCGVDLADALAMASTTPASLLRLADRGIIEPGRRADLVALDGRLEVAGVWVAGAAAA